MSKELNIAEILKDKPQGTKLYSPICGDVWLAKFDEDGFTVEYPITVSKEKDNGIKALNTLGFTAQGQYMKTGERLLFPSKNMRDWEKFAWKRGDVLMDNYGIWCMFNGWVTDDFTQFHSEYSYTIDPNNNQTFYKDKVFSTINFRKVGPNAQNDFIKTFEKEYGGKFNPETLEIEKPKQEFKDGDIIYVETKHDYKIVAIFKKFSKQNEPLVYVEYFLGNTSAILADKFDGYNILCDKEEIREIRLATEEEKELLFSKLEETGKKWDSENLKIVDLLKKQKKHKFKPFDKVLVRDNIKHVWEVAILAFCDNSIDKSYKALNITTGGSYYYRYCIPFEGNEELIGTTKL